MEKWLVLQVGNVRLVSDEAVDPLIKSVRGNGPNLFAYVVSYKDPIPNLNVYLNPNQSHDAMDNEFNQKVLEHWEQFMVPPIPKE